MHSCEVAVMQPHTHCRPGFMMGNAFACKALPHVCPYLHRHCTGQVAYSTAPMILNTTWYIQAQQWSAPNNYRQQGYAKGAHKGQRFAVRCIPHHEARPVVCMTLCGCMTDTHSHACAITTSVKHKHCFLRHHMIDASRLFTSQHHK
jgi:hypothetical protein